MVRLTVRTHLRSSRKRLRWDGLVLEAWVIAPPIEGKANLAVISALAEWLHVPASAIRLVAGHRSREKLFAIDGITGLPPADPA